MASDKSAALRKQLKIRAGVVKRLAKEQTLYTQENQDQKVKLDKLVADSADEWDIKNGVRHNYPLPPRSQDLTSDPSAMWSAYLLM